MITQGVGLYIYVGTVMLLAAACASLMGFGFNLMAAPMIVIALDASDGVPALMIAYMPLGIAMCIHRRADVDWRRVITWLVPALPGLALGIWFLRDADASTLKRFIGSVTIVSTLLLLLIRPRPLPCEKAWWTCAGGLSGILGGSAGMSGPPIVLLGIYLRADPRRLRADMICYFTILCAIALLGYWQQDMLSRTSFRCAAAGIPGLIVGFFAGNWATRHLTDERFRRAAAALMIIAGLLPWLT